MFAVKGWNVDAAKLKVQTEAFKDVSDALLSGHKSEDKSTKKRKREGRDAPTKNDESAEVIVPTADEGKKQSKKARKEERRREKLQRQQEDSKKPASKSTTQSKHESSTTDVAVQPKLKKAKRDAIEAEQSPTTNTNVVKKESTLTPMQAAMRQKLISARFRHLNETLYTAPSQEAQDLFNSNPEMFEDYHAGFRQQVSVWPENPVDKMIEKIRQRGALRHPGQKKGNDKSTKQAAQPAQLANLSPLPRTEGTCVVADCGCGDARLAQTLTSGKDLKKLKLNVLSYDLHSPNPLITKADIAALPVADGSVDVVIFCLALMGTNWISFIEEAFRVLHWKGELWIAEIKSRFARAGGKKGRVVEHSVGNRQKRALQQKAQEARRKEQEEAAEDDALTTEVDGVERVAQETDVQGFVDVLRRRGFVLKDDNAIDLGNKMFVSMEFVKAAAPSKGKGFVEAVAPAGKKKFIPKPSEDEVTTEDEAKTLKPCLYKIR